MELLEKEKAELEAVKVEMEGKLVFIVGAMPCNAKGVCKLCSTAQLVVQLTVESGAASSNPSSAR